MAVPVGESSSEHNIYRKKTIMAFSVYSFTFIFRWGGEALLYPWSQDFGDLDLFVNMSIEHSYLGL